MFIYIYIYIYVCGAGTSQTRTCIPEIGYHKLIITHTHMFIYIYTYVQGWHVSDENVYP